MGRVQNAIKALQGSEQTKTKDFIPQLPSTGFGFTGGASINRYGNKASQLSANVGAVWQANEIITIAAAGIEIKLRRRKADGYEDVLDHPLLTLINKPNDFLTGKQLRKLHFTYMNLVGEAYELMYDIDGKRVPRALHVLPSQSTEFEIGANFDTSVVKYNNDTYTVFEVLRDINPDPSNPYKGRGVVAAAAATLDTDNQAKEYNRRFFANSARPSVTVETTGELSDKAFTRLQQSFNDSFTGVENAHKPIILEGATLKPFMLTQKEMDFLASQQFTRKEILAFFFVSGAMLGDTDAANRSNMDASEYNLAKYAVKPRVEQYLELLNTRLVSNVEAGLEFYTDPIVPEDVAAKLKEASESVNNWQTIDEVRAEYNLEPLPSGAGAQLYLPANLIPINLAGTVPVATPTAEGGKALDGQKKKTIATPPLQYPRG